MAHTSSSFTLPVSPAGAASNPGPARLEVGFSNKRSQSSWGWGPEEAPLAVAHPLPRSQAWAGHVLSTLPKLGLGSGDINIYSQIKASEAPTNTGRGTQSQNEVSATAGGRDRRPDPRSQTRPPASRTDRQPAEDQAGEALHCHPPEQKPRPSAPQDPTDGESAASKIPPGGLVRGLAPGTPRTLLARPLRDQPAAQPGPPPPAPALTHGILGADPLRRSSLGPI